MTAPLKASDEIARQVAALRADGVPWKLIERRFGLDRTTLWRAMRRRVDKDVAQHLRGLTGRTRFADHQPEFSTVIG